MNEGYLNHFRLQSLSDVGLFYVVKTKTFLI